MIYKICGTIVALLAFNAARDGNVPETILCCTGILCCFLRAIDYENVKREWSKHESEPH